MGRRAAAAEFGDADAELTEVLADLESAENYKRWLLDLVRPYITGRTLEIGAGRGTYSRELREMGTGLTAVEPSAHGAERLAERVEGLTATTVVQGTISDVDDAGYGAAVMLNVLEHIEDDDAAMIEVHERLEVGGSLCIWVPAFPSLYGNFDRRVGHHRRYRRSQLRALAERTGYDVVECRYANLPGFFAWFAIVRVLGVSPTAGGLSKVYDRFVVPIVRSVERRVRPPFGQSLLVVARKRAG